MKKTIFTGILIFNLSLFIVASNNLLGQAGCVLQPPVVRIDFGSSSGMVQNAGLQSGEDYNQVHDNCPQDGNFAIVSSTGDCFGGHWITLNQDHTPGDADGRMMLINAAIRPGLFFVAPLKGLMPNKTYQLGAWVVNVCKPEFECTYIRPDLRFTIENAAGKELAKFSTGPITPTGRAAWIEYSAQFKTLNAADGLILKIENKADGGCGNDFAIDDITVRECLIPPLVVKNTPLPPVVLRHAKPVTKQVVVKTDQPVPKPVAVKEPPRPSKLVKKDLAIPTKTPVKDTPVISRQVIKAPPAISIPKFILTRENPVVKKIETDPAEIVIDLYDNGEIDGDTVTVYHNNVLIVSKAGLSEKAITFHFKIDPAHPHHELVMVANNLGSIPPNTSLMVITAADKRYEVFISSTEQKNAKVVFDLKGP